MHGVWKKIILVMGFLLIEVYQFCLIKKVNLFWIKILIIGHGVKKNQLSYIPSQIFMFTLCSFSRNCKFNGFEQTWHKCLCHDHQKHMIIISKHHDSISSLKIEPWNLVCEAFVISKQVQKKASCQSFHWSKLHWK